MIGIGSLLIFLELVIGFITTTPVLSITTGVAGGVLLIILGFIIGLGGRR